MCLFHVKQVLNNYQGSLNFFFLSLPPYDAEHSTRQEVGHTTKVYLPYSFRAVVWVLCDFSSLSEKTEKSNHLQMSLQRQRFLLSLLNSRSVGRPGFGSVTSLSADQPSPH